MRSHADQRALPTSNVQHRNVTATPQVVVAPNRPETRIPSQERPVSGARGKKKRESTNRTDASPRPSDVTPLHQPTNVACDLQPPGRAILRTRRSPQGTRRPRGRIIRAHTTPLRETPQHSAAPRGAARLHWALAPYGGSWATVTVAPTDHDRSPLPSLACLRAQNRRDVARKRGKRGSRGGRKWGTSNNQQPTQK